MRILIVEDEPKLARLLARGLHEEGHAADTAATGEEALWMAESAAYDAIVLDVMLPGLDGFAVCRTLRERQVWTPVLMLTARDAVEDRIEGLDSGADDYLLKPFAFPELAARVRALVRRQMPERQPVLSSGKITLDPASHTATYDSAPIKVAPREFAILEYLLRRKGDVVRRGEIEEHCWDGDYDSLSNVIDVYVARLRHLTGGRRSPIETVRGVGYRLRNG